MQSPLDESYIDKGVKFDNSDLHDDSNVKFEDNDVLNEDTLEYDSNDGIIVEMSTENTVSDSKTLNVLIDESPEQDDRSHYCNTSWTLGLR